jgi:hypothetical protein
VANRVDSMAATKYVHSESERFFVGHSHAHNHVVIVIHSSLPRQTYVTGGTMSDVIKILSGLAKI